MIKLKLTYMDSYCSPGNNGVHLKKLVCLSLLLLSLLLSACEKEIPATDAVREEIQVAIIKYDLALTRMYRRLDINEMNDVASTLEISKNNALIIGFSTDNKFMESHLLDFRIDDIRNISGDKADARVWEKWKWRYLNIETKEVVKPWVETESNLLYHMVKEKEKGDAWIVGSVEFVKEAAEPEEKTEQLKK